MNEAVASGAPINRYEHWHDMDWAKCHYVVKRHQARIVKATKENKWGKVKSLQHLLTHSFCAKALAVKRVSENRGRNTPGVDGKIWSTPVAKMNAINALKQKGYKPEPLRRVKIPKANGKERPLGIPTMQDRAMQALYLLALEPVSETLADHHSYGFRPSRSAADAIEQTFKLLSQSHSPNWVMEGDIKACFDNIDHDWLTARAPMDRKILRKWLKAGYVENGSLFRTESGTPQGGIISPTLANIALDGLQEAVDKVIPKTTRRGQKFAKVNFVRYADDFIITGATKEVLEDEVKPAVMEFFKARGLSLSEEKTKITHVDNGFDFLGQNVRRYSGKLFIKPSLKSISNIKTKIRSIVSSNKQATTESLIRKLNPVIRGWAEYHKHVVSAEIFHSIDAFIWKQVWQWSKRRHPKKSSSWVKKRYFQPYGQRNWVFSTETRQLDHDGKRKWMRLYSASNVQIQRHVKIRAQANPYDADWESYFDSRLAGLMKMTLKGRKKLTRIWMNQRGQCPSCSLPITKETGWDIHHKTRKVDGGTDSTSNLVMLHINCHRQTHSQGFRNGDRPSEA